MVAGAARIMPTSRRGSNLRMTPQLGFDTIGNATLIVYDGGPVLATDPWLDGPAYFGSWCLSHAVPEEQRHAVARSPLLWI